MNNLVPIVTHIGVEVLECFCGEGIWRIECYPPSQTLIVQQYKKTLNMSQPYFGSSGRMKLPLPKLGIWSPPGLPNV
jgi:hypothetical protein